MDSKEWSAKLGLHPNVSYQPTPGLVALFVRAASQISQNPRALHLSPLSAFSFSYVAIVKVLMDSGRFNGRNRGVNQSISGSSSGNGSRQGSALNHGGFQSLHQGFHPGYAGRGSFMGYGDRYGGRGQSGGRPPFHHPGFAVQKGRGFSGASIPSFSSAGQGNGGGVGQGLSSTS
jgi:hypothetical protein